MRNDLWGTECEFCGKYGLKERESVEQIDTDVYWLSRCEECGRLNRVYIGEKEE